VKFRVLPSFKPETPGQLTSVFLRGLPSQDMQVLLNGIPINQGLAGQFDFAKPQPRTTSGESKSPAVHKARSTVHARFAGVVQILQNKEADHRSND